ncbi:MAG: phosphatidylglycerol lysyltransferase domain-containing protein [Phycisphaerae bacterium]|jgi:phosphatidylglycerol lysyltransferase
MKLKLRHSIGPVFGLILFVLALLLLQKTLHHYRYRDIVRSLGDISSFQVAMAVLLTCLSYLVLTLYDTLAFKTIEHPLAYHRIALGSFLGYVFSHNAGLSVVGSGAARYRVYSTWGISAAETIKIVIFAGLTFWLGFILLSGLVLLNPRLIPPQIALPAWLFRTAGVLFLAVVAAYLLLSLLRKRPLRIHKWHFALPSFETAVMQLGLSSLDWILAASVLYVLLPHGSGVSFSRFMAVFLLAEAAGLASHIPGGLLVLDTVVTHLMPSEDPAAIVSSLLIYRAVYYLLPLGLGLTTLAVHEVIQGRKMLRELRAAAPAGAGAPVSVGSDWAASLLPRILSAAVFLGGAMLVLSGVMPSQKGRMEWLASFLPLGVIEVSHFVVMLAGVTMMFVARSLQRRVRRAYSFACVLLAVSCLASLARGMRYEESIILALMLLLLLPTRREFYRKTAILGERFNIGWVASITAVLVASVLLGVFSYKRLGYEHDLWFQISLAGSASRALRASVGVAAVVAIFALGQVFRPARLPWPGLPGDEDLTLALPIVQAGSRASAARALAGDKPLLLGADGQSFLRFAVQGRSWVALGDPAGKEQDFADLIWRFGEMSDRNEGWTVFHGVSDRHLQLYMDLPSGANLGLVSIALGEEARVALAGFGLDSPGQAGLRQSYQQARAGGWTFEMLPFEQGRVLRKSLVAPGQLSAPGMVAPSVGAFGQFSRTTVVRRGGQVAAAADILLTSTKQELAVADLRFPPSGPDVAGGDSAVADFLLLEVMTWGRDQGFKSCNLGLTPLATGGPDWSDGPLQPLGRQLFQCPFTAADAGAGIANPQSPTADFLALLRRNRERFAPTWSPLYLVAPGGLAFAKVASDLTALLAESSTGEVS